MLITFLMKNVEIPVLFFIFFYLKFHDTNIRSKFNCTTDNCHIIVWSYASASLDQLIYFN